MLTLDQLRQLRGRPVVAGDRVVGDVHELYADRADDTPTFATVRTAAGLSFVPLAEAVLSGDDVVVPYDEERIASAPALAEDEELTPDEEDRLYAHYGLPGVHTAAAGRAATAGADGLTLSEERLQVGTESVETGRARLRNYVTTRTETVQVPVRRETVVVEREPIAEGTVDVGGLVLGEEEHEVPLREEVPVVTKEAVPVERVRLAKQVAVEEVPVTEELRTEHLDDSDVPDALRADRGDGLR